MSVFEYMQYRVYEWLYILPFFCCWCCSCCVLLLLLLLFAFNVFEMSFYSNHSATESSHSKRMIYGIVGVFGNMLQQQEQIEIKRDTGDNKHKKYIPAYSSNGSIIIYCSLTFCGRSSCSAWCCCCCCCLFFAQHQNCSGNVFFCNINTIGWRENRQKHSAHTHMHT